MGSSQKLREALAGGPARDKERKEPAVADGILSVTPDPPEAAEWRNKSVLDIVAADSSFHQAEDAAGKRPTELFGKFTWRIENFTSVGSKRELRSAQFDVGEYKWRVCIDHSPHGQSACLQKQQSLNCCCCRAAAAAAVALGLCCVCCRYILVYPQGCDVCNHLSLFLCVADYDKLLPGWSHFAQFTIAVVNKDPKKSKYSDTLHRFCKKEHDWGWKKFMELSKVLDGFTVADTLVIKAQVQVILDRPSRPFRCLDAQYRRELVRVYLTNVESICRRFCEDRRQRLSWLREEGSSFSAWWRSLSAERRKQLTTEKGEAILKGVVKQFFNEKEVTSTLVMDALYCGCRQLECLSRKKGSLPEGSAPPCVVINGKALTFSFALDALEVIAQLSRDFLPPLPNDKVLPVGADGLGLRSGCDEMSELRRDALERDEKRLAELGRRTVEMYAIAHVFTERLERAYRDHQAEKRMKDLIAEEEEAGRLEDERAAARAAADKEKRAKKKERKKAKKEADKAKRDAEDAERAQQEAEKRAEIERRVAEANERRRQEELEVAAQQQKQHDKKQQQQQEAKAAAQRKQQPLANGDCSTAHNGPSANGIASSSESHTHEQGKQQQQAAAARSSSDAADGPSASSSAPAAGGSGRGMPAAGSKHQNSSSSSPAAPASVADDASEVTSTSDLDDSSSMEMGSSSSKGFTPVLGRHHAHHQQQQQQQPGTASARGGQPPGQPSQQQQAASGSSQQQQQQQPGSIPTGYAAAVAGMRTPPAAEVVSAAAALAEQARRYKQLEEQHRELEQQVSGYKQQVEGLEASVANKDANLSKLGAAVARQERELSQQEAVLSQRAAAIAQKDAALAQKDQQLAQLREQVAAQQQQLAVQQQQLTELCALQTKVASELRAVSSRGSSKDGGGVGRKVSGSSEDEAAAVGGSGRGRGHSGDLASAAEALASSSSVVDGYSPSAAPWAAVAAGTACAAGPVGSSLRDSGTASSSGSQDLAAAAAAGAAANGLSSGSGRHGSGGGDGAAAGAAAASGPLSYAESVGGQGLPQHMAPPGLQSHPSAGSIGTPRAGAGAGPGPGSSGSSGAPGTGRGSPAAAGDRLAGNRLRQLQGAAGKEPAAGAAADDSGIGRSRFVSSAPQQRQQHQHGSGMPASRAADDTRGAALGKGAPQAGSGSGSYLSNGIAGVLHSSVPPSNGSPGSSDAPLHSYRNAAAAAGAGGGRTAAGMGPSSIAAMGGAGGGAAATAAGMLGGAAGVKGSGVGGGSLGGVGSKVPGSLAAQQQQQQQQHPFAYASNLAGGGGFGSMAAGPAAKGPNDASAAGSAGAAQHPASTASSLALDDAGMDGFVHMHMIDELLTE